MPMIQFSGHFKLKKHLKGGRTGFSQKLFYLILASILLNEPQEYHLPWFHTRDQLESNSTRRGDKLTSDRLAKNN